MQASLLGAERLEGDNQYFCGFCQAKVDAQRQIQLASLPPYLCLSLQRFVFDMKVRHPPRLVCCTNLTHRKWRAGSIAL